MLQKNPRQHYALESLEDQKNIMNISLQFLKELVEMEEALRLMLSLLLLLSFDSKKTRLQHVLIVENMQRESMLKWLNDKPSVSQELHEMYS